MKWKGKINFETTPDNGVAIINDNDARLTDERVPVQHTADHKHGGDDEVATVTPAANAIPKADGTGKLAVGWLPASSLPEMFVVADATARIALTVQEGDEAKQTSDGSHWIYDGTT